MTFPPIKDAYQGNNPLKVNNPLSPLKYFFFLTPSLIYSILLLQSYDALYQTFDCLNHINHKYNGLACIIKYNLLCYMNLYEPSPLPLPSPPSNNMHITTRWRISEAIFYNAENEKQSYLQFTYFFLILGFTHVI